MLAEMGTGGMNKVADGVLRSCFWMSVMVMRSNNGRQQRVKGTGKEKQFWWVLSL
jgi:hypothetical protein